MAKDNISVFLVLSFFWHMWTLQNITSTVWGSLSVNLVLCENDDILKHVEENAQNAHKLL